MDCFHILIPKSAFRANHPLRKIRQLVREVLGELDSTLVEARASHKNTIAPCCTPLQNGGEAKRHGTMRKTKHRGLAGVAANFMPNLIAYNLIRIPRLADL